MEGLVIRLRALVRNVAPRLIAEGWSKDEVHQISPTIKRTIAAGDEQALRRWCAWLSNKLPAHVSGRGVVPVLPDAAEQRLAETWWKRRNG